MFQLSARPSVGTTSSCQLDAVGDMDVFAASVLRQTLGQASAAGMDVIQVDLSGVTWINGSALRHVANTRRWMWDLLDVDLDLVEWSSAVTQMSTRARLDGVLGRAA